MYERLERVWSLIYQEHNVTIIDFTKYFFNWLRIGEGHQLDGIFLCVFYAVIPTFVIRFR